MPCIRVGRDRARQPLRQRRFPCPIDAFRPRDELAVADARVEHDGPRKVAPFDPHPKRRRIDAEILQDLAFADQAIERIGGVRRGRHRRCTSTVERAPDTQEPGARGCVTPGSIAQKRPTLASCCDVVKRKHLTGDAVVIQRPGCGSAARNLLEKLKTACGNEAYLIEISGLSLIAQTMTDVW